MDSVVNVLGLHVRNFETKRACYTSVLIGMPRKNDCIALLEVIIDQQGSRLSKRKEQSRGAPRKLGSLFLYSHAIENQMQLAPHKATDR